MFPVFMLLRTKLVLPKSLSDDAKDLCIHKEIFDSSFLLLAKIFAAITQ